MGALRRRTRHSLNCSRFLVKAPLERFDSFVLYSYLTLSSLFLHSLFSLPFSLIPHLFSLCYQVFLVRKAVGKDVGKLYAMKVLKKASLKGALNFLCVAGSLIDPIVLPALPCVASVSHDLCTWFLWCHMTLVFPRVQFVTDYGQKWRETF